MANLDVEEAKALHELIDQLSGWNAANVFAWDGTDDLADPGISACAKIFEAAGQRTPWTRERENNPV